MIYKYLASFIHRSDRSLRRRLEKSDRGAHFYDKRVLSLVARLMVASNYRLFKHSNKYYYDYLHDEQEAIRNFLSDTQRADKHYRAHLRQDMMKAFVSCHLYPSEYFLYHIDNQGYTERKEWLSDWDRIFYLQHHFKAETFRQLQDKELFYQLAKPYFHREICVIDKGRNSEDFLCFVRRHPRFIVKQMTGSEGKNIQIYESHSDKQSKELYDRLAGQDRWLAEELIVQDERMAIWCRSCVNTIRMPSFLWGDQHKIFMPILRAGREGSVVDNSGSGGTFACIDSTTGIINTDGVDKLGRRFESHPDSHLVFKGWQVPEWEELCKLTLEIHQSLPDNHKYVGFDFALTPQGWVLVEGNWGQFFVQAATQKGIRRPFLKLISPQ